MTFSPIKRTASFMTSMVKTGVLLSRERPRLRLPAGRVIARPPDHRQVVLTFVISILEEAVEQAADSMSSKSSLGARDADAGLAAIVDRMSKLNSKHQLRKHIAADVAPC